MSNQICFHDYWFVFVLLLGFPLLFEQETDHSAIVTCMAPLKHSKCCSCSENCSPGMAKSKLTNVAIASPFGKAHPKQEAYELNTWTQQESLIIIIHFLGIVLDISAPASIRISLVWFNSEEIYSSEGTTESES